MVNMKDENVDEVALVCYAIIARKTKALLPQPPPKDFLFPNIVPSI